MELQIGSAHVHIVDTGHGTPTLLLHGIPDSSEVWSGILPALSPHFRCIAPDLPGFGHSTAPADFDCSLQGMAAFVDGLVSALDIREPLHLVVHDIGGPYGLAWAIRHPHKVRSLAIMNTVFFHDYQWHLFARLCRTPIVGEVLQALLTRRGFVRALRRASRELSEAQIHRTYDLITPMTKRMMLRWYRATDPQNFRGWEERLLDLTARVPTLVLWGDRDPYIAPRFADRFGAKAVEHFARCGHWLPVEAPAEVARRLLDFFSVYPKSTGVHAGH